VKQEIRFCTASDGLRLAYAISGRGPPLVKAGNWLTHLEFDWESPVWRHWMEGLSARHTLVRYDERGCGLSDREVGELSLEQWVADLESVVEAAGVERFALLGVSGGGPVAVAYAVRHPDRVGRLVLYGTYARGRGSWAAAQREQAEVLISLVRVGWAQANPVFRRVFTNLFIPEATPEQMEWFDELQRVTTSAENAVKLRRARQNVDVAALAAQVSVPTLVMHARDDALVPFEHGRLLATTIPGARLVTLEGRNHILLADEPVWQIFLSEFHTFLGTPEPVTVGALSDLSAREREVMELVAGGLSNEEIAERLFLSVRTVERHLSNVYAKLRVSGKAARAAAAARFSQRA
jgi:pimeloyl-ACP methyl ester carboxylesterase/DNA-binding CsgD family transcriptional regulator